LILTIFIVSLFAISAVSAEDNATSDAAIMETTIDDDTSVDEISDNEILENANDCGTFNELSDMIIILMRTIPSAWKRIIKLIKITHFQSISL